MIKWILIGIGAIILYYIIVAIIGSLNSSRCPNCGKYRALKFVKEEVEKEENCTILEKHDIKDKEGKVIGSTSQRVNGKRLYIKKIYQCKYCEQYHYEKATREKII